MPRRWQRRGARSTDPDDATGRPWWGSARGIWPEATHAIDAHRSDRSGGNVARPSRQPSHSNAVVRGHQYGRFLSLQLHSANLRNVRAGGDRRQPRILRSEPELPRARIRSAQGQAEAILSLISAANRRGFSQISPASRPRTSREGQVDEPDRKNYPPRGMVSAPSSELKTCTPAIRSAWASGHFSAQTARRDSSARRRDNVYG